MLFSRRPLTAAVVAAVICLFLLSRFFFSSSSRRAAPAAPLQRRPDYRNLPAGFVDWDDGAFHWANVKEHNAPPSLIAPPEPRGRGTPIQHPGWVETPAQRATREARRAAVRGNFTAAWRAYKAHAWLRDEVGPLTGQAYDYFGGWAATLVDGLDTLWIMGLTDEFEDAVRAVDALDFSNCSLAEVNVFETTIRHLGGLLAAHDLTDGAYPALLRKALELGEMVYKAFDTPSRMPATRWDFARAKAGFAPEARASTVVAELGSLGLEMTRLAQISGDDRFYDAVARVTDELEAAQMRTALPGLWPTGVDAAHKIFDQGSVFTLGGMADSLYEYLPKQYLLLGRGSEQLARMYERAMAAARRHIFFRPMTPDDRDILFAGTARVRKTAAATQIVTDNAAQHLACFVGGMLGLGAKAFDVPSDVDVGLRAAKGCAWAYEVSPRGIMPEVMRAVQCPTPATCAWDEGYWLAATAHDSRVRGNVSEFVVAKRLAGGVTAVDDRRYGLRPEAIESLFVMFRVTADYALADTAWGMFESIVAATATKLGAFAALGDCTDSRAPRQTDRMESYWFAETLKYFYLMFDEHDHVSLDDWVFNTEAHPLKRPP